MAMTREEAVKLMRGQRVKIGDLVGTVAGVQIGLGPYGLRVEIDLDGGGAATVTGEMIDSLELIENYSAWKGVFDE